MKEWIDSLTGGHFLAVYLFLLVVVSVRSSMVYWLGRYGAHLISSGEQPGGRIRKTAWDWAHSQRTLNAVKTLRTRGWIVIPFSYLTVGFQTVVTIAAGVVGMSWPYFALVALPGWLAWALIYSTIGFAVWAGMVTGAAGSPQGIALITILCAVSVFYVARARRRSAKSEHSSQDEQSA